MMQPTLPGRLREAIAQAEIGPSIAENRFAIIKERRASGVILSLDDPVIYETAYGYGPGIVVFTEDELNDSIDMVAWLLGEEEVRGLPGANEWQEILVHEKAHRIAAIKMGAKDTQIGLKISRVLDPETGEPAPTLEMFFNQILDWQTTNMGDIAVSLAPISSVIDGGYGDAVATRYRGFDGTVREFGELVVAHNAALGRGEPKILVPPGIDWTEHPYDDHLAEVDRDLTEAP